MLWGIEKAQLDSFVVFDSPILQAQLHPRNECVSSISHLGIRAHAFSELCLAVTVSDPPYLVDLKLKERKSVFKDQTEEKDKKPAATAVRSPLVLLRLRYSVESCKEGRNAEPSTLRNRF